MTVSSRVSASFSISTTRGLTGCTCHLRERCCRDRSFMLAQQPLHGEDTAAAVPPGAGRPAHLRERTRAVLDGLDDVAVADDLAVADDHGGEATLTAPDQHSPVQK